jgi:hypothetical protein
VAGVFMRRSSSVYTTSTSKEVKLRRTVSSVAWSGRGPDVGVVSVARWAWRIRSLVRKLMRICQKSYLKTNAINVNTVALDELDNALGTKSLVAIVLEVVVVVEEVGLGASLLGELEGKGEESLADGVIEWRRAVGTILVESLIDNVLQSEGFQSA